MEAEQATFEGNAAEYFRIWIVNLLLSVVTLGIYSAWATVRNRRYFYGNTEFRGHRFDFHGKPLAILKGRLLAAALFLTYVFGSEFHPAITVAALVTLLLGFPWMLVRAMHFRLANTSHRGLRFGFTGETRAAYRELGPLLAVITVVSGFYIWTTLQIDPEDQEAFLRQLPRLAIAGGLAIVGYLLLWPVLLFRIRRFTMNHIRFGNEGVEAPIRVGVYWKAFALAILVGVVGGVGAMTLVFTLGSDLFMPKPGSVADPTQSPYLFMAVTYGVLIPVYLLPWAIWHCITNNHVFNVSSLGTLRFDLRLDALVFWWIQLTNAVAAVLTLGLAIPWAKVRLLRYRLSRLSVRGDTDEFLAGARSDPGAAGDEIGEMFDLDFGF
ncbi:MAG: YjgN family protein [Xanthomonadales bacterium]|jgi:uncharacterized membrane protein YjgN (DUF898 family)|nr:YjgN family protein [Xanthomonadales bacterium]